MDSLTSTKSLSFSHTTPLPDSQACEDLAVAVGATALSAPHILPPCPASDTSLTPLTWVEAVIPSTPPPNQCIINQETPLSLPPDAPEEEDVSSLNSLFHLMGIGPACLAASL
jgi:hypothetical protein